MAGDDLAPDGPAPQALSLTTGVPRRPHTTMRRHLQVRRVVIDTSLLGIGFMTLGTASVSLGLALDGRALLVALGLITGIVAGLGLGALMARRRRRQLAEAPTISQLWFRTRRSTQKPTGSLPVRLARALVQAGLVLVLLGTGFVMVMLVPIVVGMLIAAMSPDTGVWLGSVTVSAAVVTFVVDARALRLGERDTGWRLLKVGLPGNGRRVMRTYWAGRIGHDLDVASVVPPGPAEAGDPTGVDELPMELQQFVAHHSGRFHEAADAGVAAYEIQPKALIAYTLSCSLARAGSDDEALAWLRQAADDGWSDPRQLRRDRDLALLRGRPEMQAITEKANDNARAARSLRQR